MARGTAPLLAIFSASIIVAVTWHTPQQVYSDPAWQLKALQQHIAGQSPTFNTLVQPDAADLSRNHYEWITHWPILMGLIVWGLTNCGAALFTAVRIIAVGGFLTGAVGWAIWITCFDLPDWLTYSVAAVLRCIRYANNPLFSYSAEGLAFALGPWMLVFSERLVSRWSVPLAVLTGCLLGTAYWAKYSLGMVSMGVLVFLLWRLRAKGLWAAVPCVSLMLFLNALNKAMAGVSSLVTEAPLHLYLNWRAVMAPIAFVPLQMADLDSLLNYTLLSPGHPLPQAEILIYLVALPGAVLLAFLLRPKRSEEWLAATVAIVCMMVLAGLWLTGRSVSFDPRHLAIASLGLLPFATVSAYRWWPTMPRAARYTVVAAAIVYLAVPVTYGAASVVGKRKRMSPPLITALPQAEVLYIPTPVAAIQADSREIITWADFEPESMLRAEVYRTSAPMRVAVLLPPHFEHNGKAEIIRRAFPQAQMWAYAGTSGAYNVWVTELKP